jgi:hypothetical protein
MINVLGCVFDGDVCALNKCFLIFWIPGPGADLCDEQTIKGVAWPIVERVLATTCWWSLRMLGWRRSKGKIKRDSLFWRADDGVQYSLDGV